MTLTTGAPLSRAAMAVIALHGRGSNARDILGLADGLALPDVHFVAPEAPGNTWYPTSFLAPLAANQPKLDASLGAVEETHAALSAAGFGAERVAVIGFSQGACVALEWAARRGRPLAAVFALSGGLIGTGEGDGPATEALYGHRPKRFDYAGRLDGTAVLIGCHERDPHIPLARVHESGAVLRALGADVTVDVHPGEGHSVTASEVAFIRARLNR